MGRIVMYMKWSGVTKDHYESIKKAINWEKEKPKGAVFHIASFDKSGMRVTDVWESEKDFNDFAQKRIMPAVRKMGIRNEPEVEIHPAHSTFAAAYE